MIQGWTDGRILDVLAALAAEANVIVEVGVWKGRSAIAMAKATNGTVYAVDTWLGSPDERDTDHIEARDNPLGVYMEFLRNVFVNGVTHKIVPLAMPSMAAMYYFKPETVDLVYIDGDHSAQAVTSDVAGWLNRVKPGGVICGDDYICPSVAAGVRAVAEILDLPVSVSIEEKFWIIRVPK